MTTASNAIKACIEDNWNVGSGGTEPTVYTSAEEGVYPSGTEWVFLKTWEYGKRRKRRNDSFVKEDDYVGLRVHTMNHANKEERLDEMVNEIYRIITPTNVTGYHKVDIIEQHRRASDKRLKKYVADLTVELKILSTSSTSTPGSVANSVAEFDELTINTFIDLVNQVTEFSTDGTLAGDSDAALPTEKAVKTYVDAVILTEDTLAEMNDVTISSPADNEVLAYDNGTSEWINQTQAEAGLVESHDDLDDTTLTGAYLEDLLIFGSDNAAWVPMSFVGAYPHSGIRMNNCLIYNVGAGDTPFDMLLPIPCVRQGLKLHIKSLKVGVVAADEDDYISLVTIWGVNGATRTSLDTDATDHTTTGDKTFAGGVMPAAAIDVSSYQSIYLTIANVHTTANQYAVTNFRMQCYYAA